jgi:cation diffusion facilitator family transporter
MSGAAFSQTAAIAARAAGLSLLSNLGLMFLKLATGVITGSIAVLSDGIDSAQDVVASGIAFASVRFGARPPDLVHPYGHGRAETVAAGTQGLLITAGAVYITYRAVQRLLDPPASIGTDLGLVVMLLAAAVSYGVYLYARRAARLSGSPAIYADARHLMTNVVQAGAIVLGLAMVAVSGEVVFDAVAALLLAGYLYWTAASILWSVLSELLDVSLGEEDIRFIEQAILAERDEIAGFHRLRTRRSGRQRNVDLHLIVPPQLSVSEAHAISDRIEQRLKGRWPDAVVMIHTEPSDGRFLGPYAREKESRGLEGERGPRRF